MLKIVAVCGNGMGTSMIIKIKLETILKKLNIAGQVEAVSVGQASGVVNSADIIVCSTHLKASIPAGKAKVATVKNLMDENEITIALQKVL